MTEKHYGGAAKFEFKDKPSNASKNTESINENIKQSNKPEVKSVEADNNKIEGYDDLIKAGKIAAQARTYALSIAKKGISLLELANKIEEKIAELGGKPAFPVNLSINEIAAHDTPAYNDIRTAYGLLKIDLGAHINGYVADTAVSVDLEESELNKKLISTAEECLKEAMRNVGSDVSLGKLGSSIEQVAKKTNLLTIRNLSGHSIEQFSLHAGTNIPNYDTNQIQELGTGVFAIEPFVTNGSGAVRDGKLSGIYHLEKNGSVRDNFAREVLVFIAEEYATLPFCSRWIYKKFGARGLLALRQIETAGLLHQYSQLVENGLGLVAQAEHTFIVEKDNVIATTL
jgi:methionyl aminopeptidase